MIVYGDPSFETTRGELLECISRCVARGNRDGVRNALIIAGELEGIRDFLTSEQKKKFDHPQYAEVKAGEAIFHHSLTLHGSGENKSDKPRRAFVINAFADGVISDSNEPLLEGVPVVQKGEKMQGQFFPLLFDPSHQLG